MICVGNDGQLKVAKKGKVENSITLGGIASQVELTPSQTDVIVGMRNGDVRVFPTPLGSADDIFLGAHSMSVTAIRVSDDGATIVTGAEDGSVCVFIARPTAGKRGKESALSYAEEILVEKKKLQNCQQELEKLKAEVQRTKEKGENELRGKTDRNALELERKTKHYKNILDKEDDKHSILKAEKSDKTEEYEKQLCKMQRKHEA
eukprot:UN22933